MAPSRRQSNGRSPLVNKQFQITSFFSSKLASSAPSPLQNPDPTPRPNPNSRDPSDSDGDPGPSTSPSPSPATPSPVQFKPRKKRRLVIPSAPAPSTARKPYGPEVLRRRIRVYWPLDEAWYEGCVKSFDEGSGKHLVQYDDAEEELLDLGKEKIEWVEESAKRFRRLRRGGSIVSEKVVEDVGSDEGGNDCEDDSSDEDWGKSVEKEAVEDAEGEDMGDEEFIDEQAADEKSTGKSRTRKRKVSEGSESGHVKKNKTGSGVCNEGSKGSEVVSGNKSIGKYRIMLISRLLL